jgi:hypothetical protein
MKRFLVFAGSQKSPRGGWLDFKGSFDTLEDVLKASTNGDLGGLPDWWKWMHTHDTELGTTHHFAKS